VSGGSAAGLDGLSEAISGANDVNLAVVIL